MPAQDAGQVQIIWESWGLYLNAWFSPYFTSAWDAANYTGVYAGGNSGLVVEYRTNKCESC